MSNAHENIEPRAAGYMRQVSLRESQILQELRRETANLPAGGMQISPEQGQLMALLIGVLDARRTIEIGVFTGYSSICVAMALPEDGKIVACDVSEEWTSVARRYWKAAGVDRKIELRLAPALDTLDALLKSDGEGSFDFAFIDADKSNYDAYYEGCLRLLRRGGIVAIDNVLWHGRAFDDSNQDADTIAIRRLNLKLRDDRRVAISLLPIGDGVTLAAKL